jgi:hypothetical protein
MNGLMLHAGANVATLDQLNDVPTPEPYDGWTPVAHRVIRDAIADRLTEGSLAITEETIGLYKDGARAFGVMSVRRADIGPFEVLEGEGGYGLVFGWRNSHDKSFAAACALGSRVFVCDNLAFSGEVQLARKHTRYILRDLPSLVERAIAKLAGMRQSMVDRYTAYQQREITRSQANDMVIRALDAKAVTVTRIPSVLAEYRNPRHEEFKPRTLWSLFNSFTEVAKEDGLPTQQSRSLLLQSVFDRAAGVQNLIAPPADDQP